MRWGLTAASSGAAAVGDPEGDLACSAAPRLSGMKPPFISTSSGSWM